MNITNTLLDDLSAVIGFTATVRLAAWYGDAGTLYVPSAPVSESMLVRLIGPVAAGLLSAEWGGELLDVPRLHAYTADVRLNRVCRLLEQGFSTREVARMERMGQVRVIRMRDELCAASLLRVGQPSDRTAKPPRRRLPATATAAAAPEVLPQWIRGAAPVAGGGASDAVPTRRAAAPSGSPAAGTDESTPATCHASHQDQRATE